MAEDRSKSGWSRKELEDFRALQEEMLHLSREYSRARETVWAEETRSLTENWRTFSQEWQAAMEETTALAAGKFGEIAMLGEASGDFLSQTWQKSLAAMSGQVDGWGEHFLQMLQRIAGAWAETMGAMGGGGGFPGFLGPVLDIGGWFHQGGIVEAHQGLAISPQTLMADEQLVLAQAGEGILPRDSMARLGEANFEALRTGRFEMAPGGAAPRFDITIQVQSLDAAGVAGLDWDRLVQRHLLPALQKEAGSRW